MAHHGKTADPTTAPWLRRTVATVAILNLAYFGVEFAVVAARQEHREAK